MTGYRKQIGAHVFYNAKDYANALQDEKKIAQIRTKVDFEDRKELEKLYQSIEKGTISFRSVLGRDFEDEVYEKLRRYRQDNAVEKEARRILSLKERRRHILMSVCAVVAAGCLGYFAYYYSMYYKSRQEFEQLSQLRDQDKSAIPQQTVTLQGEDDEEIVLTVLDEYKTLYNKNKSLIGWLKIADTNGEGIFIDYPVMQSQDKEYYLTHNFYQEYDKNGSIFLDPECDVVHRSTNLIIYGHHMKSGEMFGNLDRYSSEAFFEDHRYIQFDTIYEKGTYEVMYVFRSRIYNEDEIVFKYYQFINVDSEAEFYSNMDEMAKMSMYDTGVSAVYGDELLTLSTCDYQETNGRFVVVAKRIA